MDKEKVYENIYEMINGGLFFEKYVELTRGINLTSIYDSKYEETVEILEEISAKIFNAILIGCQLFDEQEKIIKFVNMFSSYLDPYSLTMFLEDFGITESEALERLKHGFGVHFTTINICNEIIKKKVLIGYGKNAMFTKEEDEAITKASEEQQENSPDANSKLNYLFKGWGTGVSSYSSMTNGFWMYHTPESLSFLFGNISERNKEKAMMYIAKVTSALEEENKKVIFKMMSNIYDRLIGTEQAVGCILIDRDAFKYEIDYYYNTVPPTPVERRPFSRNFNDLVSNDNKINTDIDISYLKFLKIPTILELERKKQIQLENTPSAHKL